MPDQKKKYGNINIIPLNKEKYLQFEIRELRFLDSYQFLSTFLEELVSLLLKAGKKHFTHTQKHLGTSDLIFCEECLSLQLHDGAQQIQGDATPSDRVFPGHLER